jgi:hypothetical protein
MRSGQRAALLQLVGTVRAEAMIFNNADGEMSLAVLEAGLSDARRESLKQIYITKFPNSSRFACMTNICFVSVAYYSFNSEICILRQCESIDSKVAI